MPTRGGSHGCDPASTGDGRPREGVRCGMARSKRGGSEVSPNLEGLSRSELEREAQRRGVLGAAGMTREQLVAAVRAHNGRWGRRARALGVARAVMGRVVTMAAGALPETPRRILASLAPRLATGEPSSSMGDVTVHTPAPRSPTPAPPRPPNGEPIRTRTMARLLAEQGYLARALTIYGALERAHPHDADLRAEVERTREAAKTRRQPPRNRELEPEHDPDQEVALVAVEAHTLLVSWEVSEAGIARAQAVLGSDGVLTARLVVVAPDPTRLVRSETRQRRGVERLGEWVVGDMPAGARATASVGLCAGERFVSIAHAPTLRS